jgi:hypothetical protein
MAGANSNIQVTSLDFADIKSNFINFLQSQNTFKDYNFAGSGLSTLLDVLTYNTQYNAYYLNMVANEMFLDTALQRGSVVSHAKLLNYVPRSSVGSTAYAQVVMSGISNQTSVTLPRFTQFLSEPVGGTSYIFSSTDTQTVAVSSGSAVFNNVELKQGTPVTLTFTYTQATNPTSSFQISDANIDTSTMLVQVFPNPNSSAFTPFTLATNFLGLDGTSQVYFLEETVSGTYQISFGNGILGQQLTDGSLIVVSYISTQATAAQGANNFVIATPINSYQTVVNPLVAAGGGQERETIDSIKYQAPKTYSAQGRAVTTDDYITLIEQNNLGYAFDAVNVWGGQDNDPPAYGQVFISVKPTGGLLLTDTQKQLLLNKVIKPISVIGVTPTVVDPDYTYIKINTNVVYNQKKTNLTAAQIQQAVSNSIQNFTSSTLNTFNSTFSISDLAVAVQSADPSIITNETNIQVQKKFFPTLTVSGTYNLYYGVGLDKGLLNSGITSSPALQFRDPVTPTNIIDGVYVEEVPSSTGGVSTISIINPGFSYQLPPTVTIVGDGSGATATATITSSGQLSYITVTNSGNNYTQASVSITPQASDTTGTNAAAVATLEGQFGTLRTYYYNSNGIKTIFNPNIGTVDYVNGIITLSSFGPFDVDNPLGQLTVTANPMTTIISSSLNRIITVDLYDPSAITVNVTAQ